MSLAYERRRAKNLDERSARFEFKKLKETAARQGGALMDDDADRLQALAERLKIPLEWQHIVFGFPSEIKEGRYRG